MVNNDEWEYKIGKDNAVLAKDDKKIIIPLTDLHRKSEWEFDANRRSGKHFGGSITPKIICDYISENKKEILNKMELK